MFPWKKKREKSDSHDGETAQTLSVAKSEAASYSPTTPHIQEVTPEDRVEIRLGELKVEGTERLSQSRVQGQSLEVILTPERSSPHLLHRQSHPVSSHLDERGSHYEENLLEPHRPRGGSSCSSASGSSYHTATSSSHDHTAVSSSHDHLSPQTVAVSEKDTNRHFASLREELLQSMKSMEEHLKNLERKMEAIEHRLDSRVNEVEQQINILIQSSIQEPESEEMGECVADLPPTALPPLSEVEGNTVKEQPQKSVQKEQRHSPKKVSQTRRYTDFEVARVAQLAIAMKRRKYAQQKSQSFQVSGQLQPLQKACSQQVITWLTQKVSHWKFIARWLGLSETEVSRIISDNPNEDREQCYQMFVRWKAVSPESYTYPVLGEALRRESQELFNEFVKEVYRVETNIDLSSND